MRIAVAGGTGTVGRYVVDAARAAEHDVVVLARSTGVDVLTGAGLAAALTGVEAVVDVTNVSTLSARKARAFFTTTTQSLLRAERAAGVEHHVVLSIVGIDELDAAYYAGKLAQERAVAAGDVPFTIARTAQFHEFAGQLLAGTKGPVAVLPLMPMQPVAAREVGAHLVAVAEAGPVRRARDLVGPKEERLADVARRQLRADGVRRRVLEIRLPGRYGRGLASGVLRGGPEAVRSGVTFDQWLGSDRGPVGQDRGRARSRWGRG